MQIRAFLHFCAFGFIPPLIDTMSIFDLWESPHPLGLRVTKQHEEHEGENLFHPTANYGSHRIIYFIYFTCATCFQWKFLISFLLREQCKLRYTVYIEIFYEKLWLLAVYVVAVTFIGTKHWILKWFGMHNNGLLCVQRNVQFTVFGLSRNFLTLCA